MQDIVVVSAMRTAIGAFQGSLASVAAPKLGARALAGAIHAAGLEPADIDQVWMGAVLTAGQGQAPARQAALGAGCPTSTGAVTLNKVCGSGMRAVMSATNELRCGDATIVAAGGMESMSQAPYLAMGARDGLRLGHGRLVDSMIHDGLWDPYGDVHMGNCGELCASQYNFTREAQDAYATESYTRARAAVESGAFAAEIAAVEIPQRKGPALVFDRDEGPFKADLAKMASLRPAFQEGGTVTAANASPLNDGAAALVLTTADEARRRGLRPLARIVAHASYAHEPSWFTTAPVTAVQRALDRAGLTVADIDLWEINEAFAVVTMAAIHDLGLNPARVNADGGAVALGHPIGASGARILVTLIHGLHRRGLARGCAAICIGGGEATAVVVERV